MYEEVVRTCVWTRRNRIGVFRLCVRKSHGLFEKSLLGSLSRQRKSCLRAEFCWDQFCIGREHPVLQIRANWDFRLQTALRDKFDDNSSIRREEHLAPYSRGNFARSPPTQRNSCAIREKAAEFDNSCGLFLNLQRNSCGLSPCCLPRVWSTKQKVGPGICTRHVQGDSLPTDFWRVSQGRRFSWLLVDAYRKGYRSSVNERWCFGIFVCCITAFDSSDGSITFKTVLFSADSGK